MHPVIETIHLTKRYGRFTAVDKVNLCVGKGEIYGFLGLNGAGKTTTIRMLLGMINPTSGEARLNGKKISQADHAMWNTVGYLVETPYAYPELTVRENLNMVRRLRMIDDHSAVDKMMDQLKLMPYRDRLAKHLSLGNAQRLGIAKALLHRPEILLLDEPANGLDPAGMVEIRELLLDLAGNLGVTVFVSSHILGEIAKFATRIGIIHQARLVQELDTQALARVLQKRLVVETRDQDAAGRQLEKAGYAPMINAKQQLELREAQAVAHPEKINTLLVQADYSPKMLNVETEDLESYFLRIITTSGGLSAPLQEIPPMRGEESVMSCSGDRVLPKQGEPRPAAGLRARPKGFINSLGIALWAESYKAAKSKIFYVTLGFFAFVAAMMGLIVYVAAHPEIAGRSTVMSAKAAMIGHADWPAYFDLLIQIVLALGTLGIGVVTSWVFGREYSDRTLKDLLALPVGRSALVTAKFVVVMVWGMVLCLDLLLVGVGMGAWVQIPGWSSSAAVKLFGDFITSSFFTVLLCTPVAFIANWGRGYLPPIGYTIVTLVVTQLVFVGLPEIARFIPWGFPALMSHHIGPNAPMAGWEGIVIYGAVVLAGWLGTLAWWQRADHV